MSTQPFMIGTQQPLIKDFVLAYTASGERLEAVETVQVVARLPYCLYVPSTRYVFKFPGDGELVGVVPQKVWTERSQGSTISENEIMVHEKSVYLGGAEIVTDWIGQPNAVSGELQARNMEFDRDPSGFFRYTRLTVEFDWRVPGGLDPTDERNVGATEEGGRRVVAETSKIALSFVNHFVDTYRIVTDDVYLERTPSLVVEDIRIGIHDDCSIRKHERYPGGPFTYKCGFYPNKLGMHGIRPAMVSKPKEVVDAFRSSLESGFRPPVDELLRQNALAALERNDAKLAVIESFISLEMYVERFYQVRLSETMASTEIEHLLAAENNWRLTVRLKDLLREHFGKAIPDIDNDLWSDWIRRQQQRHGIVHRNKVPSEDDARDILRLNESVKRVLETL